MPVLFLVWRETVREGIRKEGDRRGTEREDPEQNCETAQYQQRRFPRPAGGVSALQPFGFVEERPRRRKKEDRDIPNIRGLSETAVQRVEQYRDQRRSVNDPPQFHAPEPRILSEKPPLEKRVQKSGEEKQLHMLEGRFVHAPEQRSDRVPARPPVDKVVQGPDQHRKEIPAELKPTDRPFHTAPGK